MSRFGEFISDNIGLIVATVMLLFFIFMIIFFTIENQKYADYCNSQSGEYYQANKCIVVENGSAVQYGVAKVNGTFYLYKIGVQT